MRFTDLFVRRPAGGLRYEDHFERLVDMLRNRIACRDAALLQRGADAAARADVAAFARKRGVRVKLVQRLQAKPVADRLAFRVVGGNVDTVAIGDTIE